MYNQTKTQLFGAIIKGTDSFYIYRHMKRFALYLLIVGITIRGLAQCKITENRQFAFPKSIPAGNYSGIAWLGKNHYAVVSDKSKEDGFFVFEIDVDSVSGELLAAKNLGFKSSGFENRDNEGIAFNALSNTILISGERDNRILEYKLDGNRTSREAQLPEAYRHLPANLGLEALSFNDSTRTLWTCNESDTIFIQSFDSLYRPRHLYVYHLDSPIANADKAWLYAHGAVAMCALDDGNLLVLEREFYVPKKKIGAFVNCKLFKFTVENSKKNLLCTWRTKLTLLSRTLANYEGMCLGPKLADGSRVLILVADSQNQYGSVLKDWLKTLKIEMH